MRRRWGVLATLAAALTVGGCGGGGDGGATSAQPKSEATVTGTVTIKGKAATKGSLTFEPIGSNGMPSGSHVARIGADGTYTVKSVAGGNDVTISGTGSAEADSGYNKTNVELKPGENSQNFELPLPR